ncbi:DUF11 domain-containing protein, partial [Pedobacter sp. N36a]|nr:DUF11 domain-containing protein [Pedobacter sp. N36a]
MKSSQISLLYASLFAFSIFYLPFLSTAQNPKTLEFFSTSASTVAVGPTAANQVVTFRENTNNPTGTTAAVYTANGAPVTATFSLSAQQYNTADWPTNVGTINPGVFFGGFLGATDEYAASPVFIAEGAFDALAPNFTSSSLNAGGPGNGIDVVNNYGLQIFVSSTVLRNAGRPVPGRYRMADLTISFSRPVDNPILHFAGVGATAANTNMSAEFNLVSTGITMTKLSGSPELSVTATQINNSAAIPASNCGEGGACGSVRFNGQNISSIVLRVFLRGNGAEGTWARPTNSSVGDAFIIGVSTDSPVDLSINKAASNLAPVIGSNMTFTLTANNLGNNNATGVTVNDLLPAGYTFVSATPSSGTYNSVTGVWTIGNMVSTTGTATLSIVAKVNPTGPYGNTATIIGNEDDPVSTNNASTVTPVPVLSTDRQITKTVNNASPNVGSNVVFTLNAINNGLSSGTGITVTDVLPAGYTYVRNTTPTVGSFNSGTGLWTIGNLISTGTASMTITATVNARGPYANTATITGTENDPVPANNTSTVTPVPIPITDRSIVKTVDNATPAVGSNVVFTLVATNNGPSPGTGITVTDLLPAGYTYVSSTPPAGTTYVPGTGVWTIGALANAGTSRLTITATVNAAGPYANTATITGTQTDPTAANNTSTVTPVPLPTTDRSVIKTINNATPAVGSNVVFTVVATNNGPSAGTGITVTDLLPAGYTYVSSTPPAGTTYVPGTGVWTIGVLAHTGTSTLTITATVNAAGPYTNTATISGTENDPSPANNTSTVTPVPIPTTDRSVVKTVNNATPAVGSNVVFTVVATNNGPSAGTGITVTDLLPAGYTYVSSTPPAGTTYVPGTGLWTIGALANTGTSTLTITATVNAAGPYANTATISGTENDPSPANNTSTVTPVPVPTTDRSVVKTVNNATPAVGSNVVFTVVATNNGPSPGTGITVTDLLPAGYTYVSSTPPAGTTYVSGTGLWTIGTLGNGASSTLTITATVNATGAYANTATITGTENDPTPGNNTSTSTPVPTATTDLSISKTVNNASPYVGNQVIFTLTAANAGPSNATGVIVNDLLPSGYTFVSAAPSTGTYTSGTGVWAIGNLINGANATLAITATVNPTGNYANTATVSGGQNDPTPGNNTSTSTTTPVNVQIAKTGPATASAGNVVNYVLTVSNNGTGNALAQSIIDNVPATLTNVTWTATPLGTATIITGGTGTSNSVAVTGNIPAGGGNQISINITGTIPSSATATSLSNTASVNTGGSPLINSNTVVTTISKDANVKIQKTGPATIVAGNSVSYTLNVTNTGPSDVANVNIIDNLPAGLNSATWIATPQNGAVINGAASGAGSPNLFAQIPAGTASVLVTINGVLDAAYTGTTLVNTATATPEAGVNNPVPATSTMTSTVGRQANVRVTKSGPANIGAGQAISYNMRIVNDGPSDAPDIVIADAIPTQILSPVWTATVQNLATVSAASGTGDINITGSIPAGTGVIDIVVSGTVNPATTDATTFSNTATANFTITSPVTDPDLTSNTSTINTIVQNSADVRVSKNGPARVNINDPITYTIVVSNGGAGDIFGASITDPVPASVTVSSWSITAAGGATFVGPASGTNSNIAINGDIPVPGTLTLVIQGTVNSGALPSFTNTVTVTTPNAAPTSSVTTAVNQSTDLVIQKSGPQTATAGSPVSYTIKVSNAGPIAVTGLTINDIIPADIQGITWSAAAVGSAAVNLPSSGTSNTIALTGDIAAGLANYILITVNGIVNPSPSVATINNTATVTSSGTIIDFNLTNNSSTVSTTIDKEADFEIVKTVNNAAPAVGTDVVFTLVATNHGPSDGTTVAVADLLPAGYTYVSSTPPAGTTYVPATGVWTIGALANTATSTMTITATVNAAGPYTNTATISGAETDLISANNTSTVTTVPTPTSDRSLVKTVSQATPAVGTNVVFTLVATNNGPSDGTGITVTDLLPAGYTYISSTPPAGTTYVPATGLWTIGTLANTGTSTLTITATVNATGPYANTASINGTENDPTPGNNTPTSTPVPTPTTDRSLTKTVDNATPAVGSNVVFTLATTNNGPSDGTGITVTDLLPSGYTYVSSTPPAGTTYDPLTGLWNIG